MPNYQKMYFALFNHMTSAIEYLQKAQQDAEDAYMESDEPLRLDDYLPHNDEE